MKKYTGASWSCVLNKAEIIPLRDGLIPPERMDNIVEIVLSGGLIVYPTETLYGLGGNARDESVAERIFHLKERPPGQPLPLIISGMDMLGELAGSIPLEISILAEHFWPGPLTLVVKASEKFGKSLLCGGETIAVRISSHPVAHALTEKAGVPLISTSANPSGKSTFVSGEDAVQEWGDRIDLVLDDGTIVNQLPSTILDLSGPEPMVLREGAVSSEKIFSVLGGKR